MSQSVNVSGDVLDSKFRQLFRTADADGDGIIDGNDVLATVTRMMERFSVQEGSPREAAVRMAFSRYWEKVEQAVGGDTSKGITPDQYVAGLRSLFAGSQDAFESLAAPLGDALLALADIDGNGELSKDEFYTFESSMNMSDAEIEAAFRALDRDGDGVISREEVIAALRDFYTSDDPNAAGNAFFGGMLS